MASQGTAFLYWQNNSGDLRLIGLGGKRARRSPDQRGDDKMKNDASLTAWESRNDKEINNSSKSPHSLNQGFLT